MKSIKRILNLILITVVIISAFMATNVLAVTTTELDATAIKQQITPEVDSVQNDKDAMEDNIVEKWEYLSDYDMFCSQRGVEVWNVAEKLNRYITLTSEESGYKTIDVGHIYQKNDTYSASGYTAFSDKTSIRAIYELMVEKDEDGNIIPNPKVASPEEAYILSEMFNNTNEHENRNVIEFQEDEDGKEEVEDVVAPALLEHYYVFSLLEGDTEVRIYKIYGTYWKYDGGFLIPIVISEEEVYDAVNYNRSYVQRAWWRTDESKNTTEIDGGKFSQEAKAFEEYILDITGKDSADELEYQETEYEVTEQFVDGTTKVSTGTVTAPVIEYTPEWVEIEKTQDVLWDADNERYLVGPFAIDYYTQADDIISEFKFAGIESSTITTNIGNLDLDLDGNLVEKEYTFLHNGKIDSSYPAPNSEFYIVVPYVEGLKELYNIEFKFKYMNAGGEYVKYKGTAYKETWGISGNTVKKVREEVIDLQDMTQVMKAARWYEETTLSTNAEIGPFEETHKGNLKIIKNVVDENGKPIQVEEDKIFKFKVTTIRPNEEGEYKNTSGGYLNAVEQTVSIKVAAGTSTSSVQLEEETWEGDKAPLYEIEEVEAGTVTIEGYNYAATELNNASGIYQENTIDSDSKEYQVVEVVANNIYSEQKYEKGKLRIIKEIVGEPLSEEKVFEFLVKVNIDGEEKEETVEVVVSKGSTLGEGFSKEYVWKEGKTATYTIDEVNVPEDFEKITGTLTGNLVNNDVKDVVAQNRQKVITHEGKIQLIKKLVDENGIAKVATENQTFTFDIFVNENLVKTQSITVEAGKSLAKATDEIIVTWTNKEGAPSYEVKERSHSTYKQVSITNSTGVLEKDKLIEVTATNTKEESKHGNLKILKVVDKPVEVNTNFEFKVIIDGKIDTIKVVVPKGATEAFEVTEDYYWKGTAPTYKVEEINIPSNYKLESISNSTGSLEENKTIEVTTKNNIIETHQGKIKIVKKLKDGKGNTFVADKPYTFVFNIVVEGKGTETKTITIPEGQSEGFTESSIYTWTGDIAPKYEVIETDSQGLNPTLSNAVGVLKEQINNSEPVEVTAVNTKDLEEYEGKIKIYKQLLDENGQLVEAKKDSTFNFRLYVTFENGREELEEITLTLPEGQSRVESTEFAYEWEEGQIAPTFRVEEKTPEGDWKEIAIENDNNKLIAGKTVISECSNSQEGPKFYKGELQITKKLTDGVNNFEGKEFKFKVKVDGHDEEIVTIKAGDSWTKEYTWEGDVVPGYTVTEISRTGYTLDSISHKYQKTEYTSESGTVEAVNDGKLKANNTVVVEAVNKFNYGYTGSIGINKIVELEDKITIEDVKNKLFKFKVTIYYDDPNEYFTYNGKAYNTLEVFKEINGSGEISPITINYEKEGNGPKYLVEEIEASEGWELVSVANAEGIFKNSGETVWADFTNRLPVNRKYILTIELGGVVWNDTNYSNGKPADSENDGLRYENEAGIANVIINIYKRSLGTDTLVMTLLTDGNGKWNVPSIEVPYNNLDENASYYVTYTYDGQTYQPTKLLASGNVDDFKGAVNNKQREKYLNNSMAIENAGQRAEFNNRFAEIFGGNAIQDNGTTYGYATGADLEYISKDITYNGYTKKVSELVTLNQDGTARYKMTASTAESGLFYPFDKKTALVSVDKVVLEKPTVQYTYHAAYPYLKSINLGLVERPHADIALEKDLDEAIIVVNGKVYKYKYGEIANTQFAEYPDLLYKQIQINQRNIDYTLNLYKSDYYYRASVYNFNSPLGGTFDTYLRSAALDISEGLNSLNLDVYLTYKVLVTNESDVYDVTVNQISDYVDSSLELVTAPEYKYVADKDGKNQNKVKIADAPEWNWTKGSEYTDTTAGWREDAPVKYTRYTTTSLNGIKLGSGEILSSKLTFKVKDKEEFLEDGTHLIQLGDKNNIAEIDKYSTYYKDGSFAGRVDEDSAPENINIQSKNSINWYEDDTDRSPTIKLGLYEEIRNINGIAWEDEETEGIEYSQQVGNGLYEDGHEQLIPNMTTKLVEKVTIDGKDYDFIWPTGGEGEDSLFKVDGKTIYELTGFDSTTVTGNTGTEEGKYQFTGMPAGNYVVRFTYGDDNTLDVSNTDAKGNIKYSGQDYKSTTYQVGTIVNNDSNSDGYIDNEWHDLESPASATLAGTRVSDARDDESRRLEVIRKSQELRYENTSIMNTGTNSYTVDNAAADDYYFDDALNTYSMEANTAKLNMNIESVLNSGKGIIDSKTGNSIEEFYKDDIQIGGLNIHVLNANKKLSDDDSINVKVIKYNVNDIDFGLETRSENNIKLDKQIEQITLKTSAGETLIDAKYSINYDYNFDGVNRTITPRVELIASESIGTENLQALNRTSTDLGFRYLNVDKDLLQGATITIKYRITALNTGEVDRCAEALKTITDFDAVISDLRQKYQDRNYTSGTYLGQIYYQGATIRNSSIDKIVTTKVKQVVDYVDNDVVFSQIDNTGVDSSWANTTTSELESNKLVDQNIKDPGLGKILDSNGVAYESDSKNNLIVSVENADSAAPSLANPILMRELLPYDTGITENNAFVNVTVSRYYSSDMDIEEVENIAETLKLYNDVGRRDLRTVQGNTNPTLGPLVALDENDSSATELITLSPPTGTVITAMLVLQVMAIVLAAVTILAGGIVIIKKKVLIK